MFRNQRNNQNTTNTTTLTKTSYEAKSDGCFWGVKVFYSDGHSEWVTNPSYTEGVARNMAASYNTQLSFSK